MEPLMVLASSGSATLMEEEKIQREGDQKRRENTEKDKEKARS